MDCAFGVIGVSEREHQGAFAHVLGRNGVGDIGDVRAGANAPDDPFHDAHIAVAHAKIGQQGDEFQEIASSVAVLI